MLNNPSDIQIQHEFSEDVLEFLILLTEEYLRIKNSDKSSPQS